MKDGDSVLNLLRIHNEDFFERIRLKDIFYSNEINGIVMFFDYNFLKNKPIDIFNVENIQTYIQTEYSNRLYDACLFKYGSKRMRRILTDLY